MPAFVILGYDHRRLYFFTTQHKLLAMTVAEMHADSLQALASVAWWAQRFPQKSGRPGFDRLRALDWVVRNAYKAGLYNPAQVPNLMLGTCHFSEELIEDDYLEHTVDLFVSSPMRRTIRVDQSLDPHIAYIAGPFPAELLRRIKSRHQTSVDDGPYPVTFCGASSTGRRIFWIIENHPSAELVELDLPQFVHILCALVTGAR
jgi:hypothetical protein